MFGSSRKFMSVPWGIDSKVMMVKGVTFCDPTNLTRMQSYAKHPMILITDYGCPVRKSPSLHAVNQLPLPNF